jgi:hypothetical protein
VESQDCAALGKPSREKWPIPEMGGEDAEMSSRLRTESD